MDNKEGSTLTTNGNSIKINQFLAKKDCQIPIESKQALVEMTEFPDDWRQVVRFIENQIQDADQLPTIDQCFKAWNSIAIGYYNLSLSEPDDDIDQITIEKVKNNKLVKVLERGLDFINEDKSSIKLSKNQEKFQALNSICQKYLILFYNTLAAYYLKCSERYPDDVKDELNILSTQFINRATDISYQEQSTSNIRRFSSIVSGQLNQADHEFEHAVIQNKNDVMSCLGKAITCFHKGEYSNSLEQYKRIIRNNPLCPLSIYNAAALCFHKLGNSTQAQLIFEKVLKKDPDNENAILGLAMIEANENDTNYEKLITAFKHNPNNPCVLMIVGDLYLQRGDFKRAENCAMRGLKIIETMNRKDEAKSDLQMLHSNLLVLAGKIRHANEDHNRAFKYYEDAVTACDKNPVALHYLGVIYLHLKNYQEAEKLFEKALEINKLEKLAAVDKKVPNIETMKILAVTKVKLQKTKEAIEVLDNVLENDRTDVESYLEAARLTEQTELEKAIGYYTNAIDLLEKQHEKTKEDKKELTEDDYINPIYYNNLAVLYMKTKNKQMADEQITKARDLLKAVRKIKPNSVRLKALSLTMHFNEACHFESIGRIGEATNLYKYVISQEPYYTDAYLRLALLAKQRGSYIKAIQYAEKAAKYQLDKKPIVPYCILGNFYLEQQQDSKAEKEFQRVLHKSQHDSYAHISLGNIIYNYSCKLRDDPKRQEEKLREALKCYMKAMEYDDSNAFAALGIANIIGEYGMTAEASEMYRVIREASFNVPHAMINAAHILSSQGQLLNALRLYEKALEKYYNGKNVKIEMWMARIHYQAKNFEECQEVLKSMIKRDPSNYIARFNLALCLQTHCIEVLNKDYRKVSETKRTIQKLNVAQNIFSGLIQSHNALNCLLPSGTKSEKAAEQKSILERILKVADERLFFIRDTLKNADRYLQHDIQQEEILQKKQDENIKRMQEVEEKERQQKLEEEQRRLEQLKLKEKQAEEKFGEEARKEMARVWKEEEEKRMEEQKQKKDRKRGPRGSTKSKGYKTDDFVVPNKSDDDDDDFDPNKAKEGDNEDLMDLKAAEELGKGGLEDLSKSFNKKKSRKDRKKSKKDKKNKKDRKKKSRLKRNREEGDPEDDEKNVEQNDDDQEMFNDENDDDQQLDS